MKPPLLFGAPIGAELDPPDSVPEKNPQDLVTPASANRYLSAQTKVKTRF
ncbi:hypothetical protein ACFUOZ_19545 [Paenarthrobacter sp. NPDC057355]